MVQPSSHANNQALPRLACTQVPDHATDENTHGGLLNICIDDSHDHVIIIDDMAVVQCMTKKLLA